ncbi:cation:proton antiporter [Pseudahrensia aquimaris]|uniref:Cation:proton antiporter n=1 Tax=Pseudahrensia aquimaris TaxID=744461 RepID=A0ABW3FCP5_9HYPH
MDTILIQLSAIGIAGMAAQWAAWRFQIPAIALLLAAGFLMGPLTGYIDPATDFGSLYKPIIAFAVAIILFEGGLTLNFAEIRETSKAVRRIVIIGGPLVWLFSTLAAHYAAGLTWPTAAVLGAILVITGPTVIMPLLRQAQLKHRPASLLRWEAIVNDPIGALYAVIAFEVFLVFQAASHSVGALLVTFAIAATFALAGGWAVGRIIASAFLRGLVPEYLKAPILFAAVLFMFAASDAILKESGLLTVTVMGVTLANTRLASLAEMKRFKETATILLVSGLFIMLTASFDVTALYDLGWRAVLFVVLVLFVVRPIAILIATIGVGLDWQERALVAWIAPRGIVAVAVSGLFGSSLTALGVEDGGQMTALAFVVVASTILLHGFSLAPLSRWLNLKAANRPGILIVGGSIWTQAMAAKLKEIGVPVLVADRNRNRVRDIQLADIPVHYGEILSESAHHSIQWSRFSHLIAASDNDAYNALVCSEFGPEIGRSHVYQIGKKEDKGERQSLNFTVGGRRLLDPAKDYSELLQDCWRGWSFTATTLTEEFDYNTFRDSRPSDMALVLWVKPDGSITFAQQSNRNDPGLGDTILAFSPPTPEKTTQMPKSKDKPLP